MHSFIIETKDHVQVQAYEWLPQTGPLAVLQIVHGMQEHALRYDHFARWLNSKNIAVYANDHIGHGSSAKTPEDLSHFPRKDDWQRSVDILHILAGKIQKDHPGIPVFMLGHSMGSVLVQTYMMQYGQEADGFILSGVIRQPLVMANLGILLVKTLSALYGPVDRSKLIVAIGYGPYNRKFRPNRTASDWLSSENSIVDEYISSPLCGIPLTNRFYQNFFYGFKYIARHSNLKKIPDGKPVYILAGKLDPAGQSGKAPEKISYLLTKIARSRVDLKLYPAGRHEILNEKNREEVYEDMLSWVFKIIKN